MMATLAAIALVSAPARGDKTDDDTFPYALHPLADSLVGAVALVGIAGYVTVEARSEEVTAAEIQGLRATDVNDIDRGATGLWSPDAAVASSVTMAVTALSPVALVVEMATTRRARQAGILAAMAAEAAAVNLSLSGLVKLGVEKPRPYLYNADLPLETRQEHREDAERSFYSGHAAVSFCGAVFFAKVFSDLYPRSAWRFAVWPVFLSLATATALLRVSAGLHFPTDVLVGAASGSLIGVAIPLLHRKRKADAPRLALLPGTGQRVGLTAVLVF